MHGEVAPYNMLVISNIALINLYTQINGVCTKAQLFRCTFLGNEFWLFFGTVISQDTINVQCELPYWMLYIKNVQRRGVIGNSLQNLKM